MLKPGREVSLVSWALYIAYMYYICVLCIDSAVFCILDYTKWDLGQQIPRYLDASGLLQVQAQGRVMGQPQLSS